MLAVALLAGSLTGQQAAPVPGGADGSPSAPPGGPPAVPAANPEPQAPQDAGTAPGTEPRPDASQDPPQDAPQDAPPASDSDGIDLTELSLDELLEINVEVTSVGKRTQMLDRVPAAIHVLTSEDIRRSGMRTLAEVLRLVPGLHVARVNGGAWAISSRGFNGRFNGNMLVLVDGRSLYTTLFAGVYWDAQDIPLEDVERIEVILGPGGATWGSNALNGVINVVTRRAAQTQGTLLSVLVGDEDGPDVYVRHGAELEGGNWRAWARLSGNRAMEPDGMTGGHDARDLMRGGFRADWDTGADETFTVDGDAYTGRSHGLLDVPSLSTPPSVPTNDTELLTGGHLLFDWTRRDGPSEETSLQGYVDHTLRDTAISREDRDTIDLEWRQRRRVGEDHDVVFGVGARSIWSRFGDSTTVSLSPDDRRLNLFSAFAEDVVELVPDRLGLTLGGRVEDYTYSGVDFQPSVRLAWTPDKDQTVWAAVSRAIRTPSQVEHDGKVNLFTATDTPPGFDSLFVLEGNSGVSPSELVAFELGWRARVTSSFTLDVAGYYNRYSNAVIYTPGTPVPVGPSSLVIPAVPVNDGKALARGFEVSGAWEVDRDWSLTAGWAHVDVHTSSDGNTSLFGDQSDGSAPADQIQLTSHHRLTDKLDLDLMGFHVDKLPAIDVPAYWRADVRLGWKQDERTEWSAGVRNLFHDGDLEWSNDIYGGQSRTQTSFWLGYTRRF